MKIHAIIITLFMVFFVVGCVSQPAVKKGNDFADQNTNLNTESSQTEQDVENITSNLETINSEDNDLNFSDLDNLDDDFALFE